MIHLTAAIAEYLSESQSGPWLFVQRRESLRCEVSLEAIEVE